MLEEEHRVVAADRRPQEAVRVERVRRHHDAQPRDVRHQHRARLRVVDRAAADVAADRHAHDDRAARTCCPSASAGSRARCGSACTPARCSRRTGSRRRASDPRTAMPIARPTMLASASGELKTRSAPYSRWRPAVTLKTPPLPLHSASTSSRDASATSSPKTTMRGSRFISSRRQAFNRSTIVVGVAPSAGAGARRERGARRIDVRRVDELVGRLGRGQRRRERPVGGLVDLGVHLGVQLVELLCVRGSPAREAASRAVVDRVASRRPARARPSAGSCASSSESEWL